MRRAQIVRVAVGLVVIASVILAAFLTLALAGVIGAMLARLVAGGDREDSGWRWVGVGAASGIVGGQLAAFVAFVGSAAFDWSLEGFVLPPICWIVAAVSGAATHFASRSRGDRPQVG